MGRFLIKDDQPVQRSDTLNAEVRSIVDKMIRTLSEVENKSA